MLRAFLSRIDRAAARVAMPAAVEQRLTDPNMSAGERARLRRFAEWAVRR